MRAGYCHIVQRAGPGTTDHKHIPVVWPDPAQGRVRRPRSNPSLLVLASTTAMISDRSGGARSSA